MTKEGKSRRDFFRRFGARPPDNLNLLRLGRPAMGTRFEILFPVKYRRLIESVHQALDKVRSLESKMTIFDHDSQISRINRNGAREPVEVDDEILEVLEVSCNISEETGNAFDVASGSLWRCWGFADKMARMPSEDELFRALECSGSDKLILRRDRKSVSLEKSGVELNLGSIGKGFALDRVADLLQNAGFGEALLHAGHSSFYALGNPAAPLQGWRLSVRHPQVRDANFVSLRLKDMGMATSGAGEQFFEIEGKRYGHIIDPRTGRPVGGMLSATAIAPSATFADALSTAFFSMSLSAVEGYCEEHPEVGAIIVPAVSENEELLMHCFGIAGQCIDSSEE